MTDQDKRDEKNKEKVEYEYRIDDACQRGVVKVPKEKKKEPNYYDYG